MIEVTRGLASNEAGALDASWLREINDSVVDKTAMKYEKRLLVCCGLLVASWVHAEVRDDYSTVVARSDTPRYIVTYQDGTHEVYQPEWQAILKVRREQTGHVARPLQGDLVDTRECRWSIQGQVERTLRLCTRAGCTARVEPSAALAAPGVVITLAPLQREPPPLAERILRLTPDPCGDTDARFRMEIETQRARLMEQFQQQVATGRKELTQQLTHLPDVKSVEDGP